MSRYLDAIIIDAGQAGPSLAGRLTGAGMTVALVERKLFGGTCVNTGCMLTKTLIASAYAAHVARRGADYGVMLDAPLRIDVARVKARADAVLANARAGVEAWLPRVVHTGCVGSAENSRIVHHREPLVSDECSHKDTIHDVAPSALGCEECLKIGSCLMTPLPTIWNVAPSHDRRVRASRPRA